MHILASCVIGFFTVLTVFWGGLASFSNEPQDPITTESQVVSSAALPGSDIFVPGVHLPEPGTQTDDEAPQNDLVVLPNEPTQPPPPQVTVPEENEPTTPATPPQNNTNSTPVVPQGSKTVLTTVFWVGETATDDNGYIANNQSAWDEQWQQHYGGVDDPENRCGYRPCAFTPAENPFYFALPYSDLTDDGDRKASTAQIPWFSSTQHLNSVVKNAWIEVRFNNNVCYAQWEDVGPFETNDFAYVFGDAQPKNTDGVGAGLDVSPAVSDCLGMTTNERTTWRFIDAGAVPAGPWKEIITTRDAG